MVNHITLNVDRTAVGLVGLIGLAGALSLMVRRTGSTNRVIYASPGPGARRRIPTSLDECQCPESCALDHEND